MDAVSGNPFDDALARENSNYCRFDGKALLRCPVQAQARPSLTALVHDGFRALTLSEHFSCVGAKAAIRSGAYAFGLYGDLASPPACAGVARDLFTFVRERHSFHGPFTTFVASFSGPATDTEKAFEKLLWTTLQRLHDLDAVHHRWDPHVAADPDAPQFSFSFAETAFFVIGLHAASSRAARRFAWPTLVFNPHDQFEQLRETGSYPRFQQVIRHAEQALQGDINPMLSTFGERSEAPQYSGRRVGPEWRCPFHSARHDGGPEGDE